MEGSGCGLIKDYIGICLETLREMRKPSAELAMSCSDHLPYINTALKTEQPVQSHSVCLYF
jgi:hypothetical protein